VLAQVSVQWDNETFDDFTYQYGRSIFVDLTYKETCRAQAGLGGNEYAEYMIRGMPCDQRHLYSGFLNGDSIEITKDGQPTQISFVGELFGSAKMPYFQNPINAYGRKAKAYYETADGIKDLKKSSASGCIILGASIPDQQQTKCTTINFAIGNGIAFEDSGTFIVQNWFQPESGPGYWIDTYYPFTYSAVRTVSYLENYGD
jgi:hypothetical protein